MPGWLSRLSSQLLVSAQAMNSQSVGLSPTLCSVLAVQSLLRILSPSLCPSLLSLSVWREEKRREEKRREEKREGKGREGKGREGKGREGKGREGKGREGKGREGKGKEQKGRERKGTEGNGRERKVPRLPAFLSRSLTVSLIVLPSLTLLHLPHHVLSSNSSPFPQHG